jgi:hypothetical protein
MMSEFSRARSTFCPLASGQIIDEMQSNADARQSQPRKALVS